VNEVIVDVSVKYYYFHYHFHRYWVIYSGWILNLIQRLNQSMIRKCSRKVGSENSFLPHRGKMNLIQSRIHLRLRRRFQGYVSRAIQARGDDGAFRVKRNKSILLSWVIQSMYVKVDHAAVAVVVEPVDLAVESS
jgi:hypothetical protein